jgi:hypothetical protein
MAVVMAERRPVTGVSSAATPGRALWGAEDFLRWVLAVGVGGIVIIVAWYMCSGDASFNQQIGPTNIAVAGMVLAGLGNAIWLLRGRRTLGERRRALLGDPYPGARMGESMGAVTGVSGAPSPSGAATTLAGMVEPQLFVAGADLALFHRPECALAEGRRWDAATRDEQTGAGRRACGVCRP